MPYNLMYIYMQLNERCVHDATIYVMKVTTKPFQTYIFSVHNLNPFRRSHHMNNEKCNTTELNIHCTLGCIHTYSIK